MIDQGSWRIRPAAYPSVRALVDELGVSEVLAQVLVRRGFTEATMARAFLQLAAANIAYDQTDLAAPAGVPFQIAFTNNDAGIPHNVSIHQGSPTGTEVFKGTIFTGVATQTYDVPALPAGTYSFVCSVHPNMTGTLTVK